MLILDKGGNVFEFELEDDEIVFVRRYAESFGMYNIDALRVIIQSGFDTIKDNFD